MYSFDNEKTLVEDEEHPITISSPSPPSYDCIVTSPPPPTYLQSSRLQYNNQPYISESDEQSYNQQYLRQQQQYEDNQEDTWSDIAKLPLHKRLHYYWISHCFN